MKSLHRLILLLVLVFTVVLATGCPAPDAANEAEVFPNKPITLVIPFAAGGSHEVHARLMERFAEEHFEGQPLVIQLMPGGGGAVGSTNVAGAVPDGYTLLFGSSGANTVIPIVEEVIYSRDDFIPVARINFSPQLIITNDEQPFKNIAELLEYAKANPGELSYASAGMFSSGHMSLELFQAGTDTVFNHVPMEGAEPQLAVLANQVPLGGAFSDEVVDLVREGSIIPLVVTSSTPLKLFPDVPTFADIGIDAEWEMWRAVLAPAGTPPEIVEKLTSMFEGLCNDPEFIEAVEKMGEEVFYMSGQEFASFWDAEIQRFTEIFERR